MTDTAELKPCPFCGKRPKIMDCDERYNHSLWFVICKNVSCHAYRVMVGGYQYTKSEVIKLWNTRAEPESEHE